MRRFWFWSSALVCGLAIGLGSAFLALDHLGSRAITNGAWSYHPLAGSTASGPYLRAVVAMTGLLALNQSEAIYFDAEQDSSGNPLLCSQSYRVEIPKLQARWWSISAYGDDLFLIPNEAKRYGFNSVELEKEPASPHQIVLSPKAQPGNWVPTGRGQNFSLTLRLYQPESAMREHIRDVELPRIIRQ